MKIQVENKLYIESDPMQFILKEYSGTFSKDGVENFKVHGYFTKLEHTLNKLLMMKISDSTAKNLIELLEEVKTSKHFIEGILHNK